MGAGRVSCDDGYVDACAPVYFQFHPRSVGRWVGRSVNPGTTSRHFGAETKSL